MVSHRADTEAVEAAEVMCEGGVDLKNPVRSDLEAAVAAVVAEDPSLGVKYVVKALRVQKPSRPCSIWSTINSCLVTPTSGT